jgi:tetratricopeptide (TPR) repeat protein
MLLGSCTTAAVKRKLAQLADRQAAPGGGRVDFPLPATDMRSDEAMLAASALVAGDSLLGTTGLAGLLLPPRKKAKKADQQGGGKKSGDRSLSSDLVLAKATDAVKVDDDAKDVKVKDAKSDDDDDDGDGKGKEVVTKEEKEDEEEKEKEEKEEEKEDQTLFYLSLRSQQNYEWAADDVEEGVRVARGGDHDGAIASYNRALGVDPHHANAFVARGAAYSNKHMHTQACRYNMALPSLPSLLSLPPFPPFPPSLPSLASLSSSSLFALN